MKTHRLDNAIQCPACGAELSGALNTTSDDRPRDGDPSLCFNCRALLVYSGSPANSLRRPTDDEERQFLADVNVQRAIWAIGQTHRARGNQ